MKALLGILLGLVTASSGCIFATDEPHHGREAVYVEGHHHRTGCGHVQVNGAWYDRD